MDNEIIANSEAVKEAVEAAAETATKVVLDRDEIWNRNVMMFGAGVLTTVVVAKFIVPSIKRKFKSFRKPANAQDLPVEETEEPAEEWGDLDARR